MGLGKEGALLYSREKDKLIHIGAVNQPIKTAYI